MDVQRGTNTMTCRTHPNTAAHHHPAHTTGQHATVSAAPYKALAANCISCVSGASAAPSTE
jgi:hypothetical protein